MGTSGLMMTQIPKRKFSSQKSRKRNRRKNKQEAKTDWGSLSDSDDNQKEKRNASAQNSKKNPFIKLTSNCQKTQPIVTSFNTQNNQFNSYANNDNQNYYQTA